MVTHDGSYVNGFRSRMVNSPTQANTGLEWATRPGTLPSSILSVSELEELLQWSLYELIGLPTFDELVEQECVCGG